MEFLSGVLDAEAPVDADLSLVSLQSKAWTSGQRAVSPGRRCLRQLRERMLNSISATPSTSSGQDSADCRAWGV